jgi:serine protease Do
MVLYRNLFRCITGLFFFAGVVNSAFGQSNIIKTNPPGATVYDDQKNKLGETPFDLNTLKPDITKIKLQKEDYETVEINLLPKDKKGYSFPDCISSCTSCSYQFDNSPPVYPYSGSLRLRKKLKERDRTVLVAIDTPKIDLPPKTELGKVNGNKKRMDDNNIHRLIGYPENLNIQLMNSFKNSYMDPIFLSSEDTNEAPLFQPKIIIKPVVKSMSFDLNGELLRDYTGPCFIQVDWMISDISAPHKILATFPVKTSIFRTGDDYDLILHQLLSESERDLLEKDTLYNFLTRVEDSYLARSKSSVFKIHTTPETTFANKKEMLKGVTSSVVTVENDDAFGSGIIISPDGYILTNYHVIKGGNNIVVKLGKDEPQKAQIVRENKDYDLALLKIKQSNLKPLPFANSDSTNTGDELYAIGTPLDKSLQQTITQGIISGYRILNGVNFIQTDVSINRGNSGGPLLNQKGEIVAITTMRVFGNGVAGIGFGIPSNIILQMMNITFDK